MLEAGDDAAVHSPGRDRALHPDPLSARSTAYVSFIAEVVVSDPRSEARAPRNTEISDLSDPTAANDEAVKGGATVDPTTGAYVPCVKRTGAIDPCWKPGGYVPCINRQ